MAGSNPARLVAMRFTDPDERPYFLWNEATTVAQFRQALRDRSATAG
jgi:hypothetical protein